MTMYVQKVHPLVVVTEHLLDQIQQSMLLSEIGLDQTSQIRISFEFKITKKMIIIFFRYKQLLY